MNLKDIKSTFISLVSKTYPNPLEGELLEFMPELSQDEIGNYYKIVGNNPTTMFTSHLDTRGDRQLDVKLETFKEGDDECIKTDGNTILGADDKAGVTLMLYMIDNNVTGLYYFFIGEEKNLKGSKGLCDIYDEVKYLTSIKRCISFDRKDYNSVITHQSKIPCCSEDFGKALCDEYNDLGLDMKLDPTGVGSDSASFMNKIPECTNISVGNFNEHSVDEYQNIDFLKRLAEASININWDSLPIKRKIGNILKYNEFKFNGYNYLKEFKLF